MAEHSAPRKSAQAPLRAAFGCLHLRPEVLLPRMPSSEESPGKRVPGAAPSARLFESSSAAGLHVSERRPRLLDGEADAGLDRGRTRAARRRRTSARGEGGASRVGDGGRIRATASTVAVPEPKTKEEAPVAAETKASASSARTCTRGASGKCDTNGGNFMGGGDASAGSTFPSVSSNGAAGPARSRLGAVGATCWWRRGLRKSRRLRSLCRRPMNRRSSRSVL
jgi:hypothetical protein